MSRLKEYIKLIGNGIPNIDKIVEGVLNQVKSLNGSLSEEEQEEIARRQLICHSCPLFSLNAINDDSEYKKLLGVGFKTDRKNEKFCTICGCPTSTKTSSLSTNCGLEDYNQAHPENIQELKWTEYKPKQ